MSDNFLDADLEELKAMMRRDRQEIRATLGKMRPFRSEKLTPEEESLLFDFPESIPTYQEQGMLRKQAADQLLVDLGPVGWLKWTRQMAKRRGLDGDVLA